MAYLKLSVFATGLTSSCGVIWSIAETSGSAATPPSGAEPSGLTVLPSTGSIVCSVPSWMCLSFFLSFLCDFFGEAISSFGIAVLYWEAMHS